MVFLPLHNKEALTYSATLRVHLLFYCALYLSLSDKIPAWNYSRDFQLNAYEISYAHVYRHRVCWLLRKNFKFNPVWFHIQHNITYEVVSESSRTTIVVTTSVKEDERGGQGHTSASLLHQAVTWHRAVNMHCFNTSVFDFLFRYLCDGRQNRATCLHQVLCEAR
jgi:hypothetical protein